MELGLGAGAVFIKRPPLFSCSPGASGEARLVPKAAAALARPRPPTPTPVLLRKELLITPVVQNQCGISSVVRELLHSRELPQCPLVPSPGPGTQSLAGKEVMGLI